MSRSIERDILQKMGIVGKKGVCKQKMKAWLKKNQSALLTALALVGMLALYTLLHIPCPIKAVTGVSCAGCGMTRAWISALQLQFADAFAFHPLFWVVPVVLVLWLCRKRFPKVAYSLLAVIAAADILLYIFRMCDPQCTVVVFEPAQGLLGRAISAVKDLF